MKSLPPQPLRDIYWTDIEAQLKTAFYDVVFKPVMEIIRKASAQGRKVELSNSIRALLDALYSGRIQYQDGKFSGQFNAAIASELRAIGATFDRWQKVYKIDPSRVPPHIAAEAVAYQIRAKDTHDLITKQLDDIQTHIQELGVIVDAEETIRRIDKGFAKSAELLQVQPKLDKEHVARLSRAYNENLQLYIRDFTKNNIVALREVVEDNATQGYRFDRLIELIRHRYGITANKAQFLARQETSLFMSKYRRERFAQAGVRRYRWQTSKDERVRKSHAHLNGRVFMYDQPPVTDPATGAHNNPGEDFGCRCIDIALLETDITAVV